MANLALTSPAYDASGAKFGSGALSGGFGVAPLGLLSSLPFAVSTWFKTVTTPNTTQVICGQSLVFWIGYNANGTLHFEYGGYNGSSTATVNTSTPPSNNNWHQATISLSSSTMTATLDGVVVGTASLSNVQAAFQSTGGPGDGSSYGTLGLRVPGGYQSQSNNFQFSGVIDEVAVWAADLFNSAFTPRSTAYTGSEPNLLALWHLDGSGVDSVTAAASTYALAGPSTGTVGIASTSFTVTVNGNLGSPLTITPSDSSAGGTFSPPSIIIAAGTNGSASFTYAAANAGTKTISTTNNGSLTNPVALSFVAGSPASFTPDAAVIQYSPANWLVKPTAVKSINAGAYFRTIFTGNSCALSFDVSANTTPLPQLSYRIDGASWNQVVLAPTIALSLPTTTASWARHHLEVVIKSTSEWLNFGSTQGGSRWSPQNTAVTLTGVLLANGQTLSLPVGLGQAVWVFGDSITEGYHTLTSAGSGSQDTDGSDAALGWAYQQRHLLGAEIAVIGFGGNAINTGGVLGVPSLPGSFNLLWANQARSFSPPPDLIVIAYGENDGSSTGDAAFIANYKTVLTGLLSATPASTKIACLIPFSQRKSADIATAINQVASPRVTRIDTSGMFNTADSVDGQHPLGVANIGMIGPAVANKLRPLLQGIRNRWVRA